MASSVSNDWQKIKFNDSSVKIIYSNQLKIENTNILRAIEEIRLILKIKMLAYAPMKMERVQYF